MASTLEQTGTAVVGYFATGHEAHRAINALIDHGFLPSEIGAAFHTGFAASQPVTSSLREDLGTTQVDRSTKPSSTFGAPASDSTAVQPAALGGGSGTPFGGAGRPQPISGSSLAHTGLPTELHREIKSEAELREEGEGSWAHRVGPVFAKNVKEKDTLHHEVAEDSQKFGTGEGTLNLNSRPYSQPAFERSFSGYGLQPGHARSLSHRIGAGGAIVSVHATSRNAEAERVLEEHGGQVRHAEGAVETSLVSEGNVEVFGTLDRGYTV